MKFFLVAVVAQALFVCSLGVQLDGLNAPTILLDEAPIEVEDAYNASAAAFSAYNACQLRISIDVGKPTPLLLNPGTTSTIRAINSAGLLSFATGQGVRLACSGAGNFVRVAGSPQEATAVCVSGTEFTVNGVPHTFSQLTCSRWPDSVNFASGTCLNGRHTLVKTAFVTEAGLVDVLDACHNVQLAHTIYTKFIMGRDTAGFQSGVDRPDWTQGTFFSGIDITDVYRRVIQRDTLTILLGSRSLAEEYIHLTNDYFLSKGHLVAKADFLHGPFQIATFWYTNAAPQWQTFNGGNWNSLENDVRSFAARIERDLEVYTGTAGQNQLLNVNGVPTDQFLTTVGRAPAPRMFYKILYEPITRAGIVFIGLNNPYQEAHTIAQDIRCNNIISTVTWLSFTVTNIARGYTYACEVNDFRANFPDIPAFTVTGILR